MKCENLATNRNYVVLVHCLFDKIKKNNIGLQYNVTLNFKIKIRKNCFFLNAAKFLW